MSSVVSSAMQAIGMGKFGDNSHPIHPTTVHLPITLLLGSYGFNILNYGVQNMPELGGHFMSFIGPSGASSSFDTNVKAAPQLLNVLTHLCTLAGIFTALPAVATGVVELYYMYKANGPSHPKTRTTLFHAALNDMVLVGAVYQWYSRNRQAASTGYMVSGSDAVFSGAMIAALMGSAYLGGSLVYKYGVGVQRQGEGARIKQGEIAEANNKALAGGKKEL